MSASASASASDPQTALSEFFRWESQSWIEVVADLATDDKAYFMPIEKLKAYFVANNTKKLKQILAELFKSDFPPVEPELILRDHTAIFCILLRIGRGEEIEHFARYEELSDRRLPFDAKHPPSEFSEADEDPRFLMRFCDKQRMYCVPILDGHMLHKHFGRQRLLPITNKELVGNEGMATKYVIKLYGPHNKLLPAGQDQHKNNTFVLKQYSTKDAKEQYTQEVNGFRSVKNADSIIRFYGSYIHGDESNVLLEFADKGSLEDYFKSETPPSRGLDIIKFWECLFQLIKGLKAVHSVRDGHRGVKPENIAVLSQGSELSSDWQFKFANFGLNTSGAPKSPDDEGSQAANTYSPPECYMPYQSDGTTGKSPGKVKWTSDIWSLGCIFSEAAMWVADGYKGLVDYRRQRMTESDRILFKAGDCFHDGERVLQSVLDAHRDIEDRLRRSDYITKDVLDSLVEEMLWEDDRPNAKALWRKSEMVSTRARQKLSVNSGDEMSRSGSSLSRSLPPPRLPPPTQALPPIPRNLSPGLAAIDEQQPPNVEKWRSQITLAARSSRSQFGGTGSDVASPILSTVQTNVNARSSDVDSHLAGSVASWQLGGNSVSSSPNTPFTSPHASGSYDFLKHNQNNLITAVERPLIRKQTLTDSKIPPKSQARGVSYISNTGSTTSDNASVSSAPPRYPGSYTSYTPYVPDISTMPKTIPTNMQNINGGPPMANMTPVANITPMPNVLPMPNIPPMADMRSNANIPPMANRTPVPNMPPMSSMPPIANTQPIANIARVASMSPNASIPPKANMPSNTNMPPMSSMPLIANTQPMANIARANSMSPNANIPPGANTLPMVNMPPTSSVPPVARMSPVLTETPTFSRAPSQGSSRYSTAPTTSVPQTPTDPPSYFHGDVDFRPKSQKRSIGFSLFPTKSRRGVPAVVDPDPLITYTKASPQSVESSRRSLRSSISSHSVSRNTSLVSPIVPDESPFEYLSVNTCLEWKRANKKVKKSSKLPALPGASMLRRLEGRDHVFIIDDSSTMEPVWPDVKRVFEALSYTVKNMSPEGTELFYTVSYDTWRRKDTTDLCTYLDKKGVSGKTNICYRLNLQLQSLQARVMAARTDRKKAATLRPTSFYVLTNGEWDKLAELKALLRSTAEFLKTEGRKGLVTVEFVSFAVTAAAATVINELDQEDFGIDIVDCTRWTGNVMKMLLGPLDKSAYANETGGAEGNRASVVISDERVGSIISELE